MPIMNRNVQVIFGTGDVSVRIGCHSDKSSGVVQFNEIEPRGIGEELTHVNETMGIDEAPVSLIFNKIESLDAVIYQLQKLRDIMSEEDKYEWTKSGEVLGKNQ